MNIRAARMDVPGGSAADAVSLAASVGVQRAPPGRPKARIAPPWGAANEVSVGVLL